MNLHIPHHLPQADARYLRLSMPAAIEGICMVLLSSVDIIMVSSLGLVAVAAVSIFTQPRMMLLCVSRSVASALTVLAAQCYGAGCKEAALAYTGQTLTLTAIVLGILHIIFYCYLGEILSWMGADNTYLTLALEYGNIAIIAVFITSLATVLQALQMGFAQTQAVLVSNVQGNVVNIIGNALLIFGLGPFPELGVQGAAIATVIGSLWSLGVTLWYLNREEKLPDSFLPDKAYFKEFMPIFGSIFSEQSVERFGMVVYTRMIAELGPLPYAVHAICMNFCDIYYCFAGGLGKASMVLAGHARGARDYQAWKSNLQISMRWGMFFAAIAFALTLVFREEIFMIYSDDVSALPLGALIMAFVAIASFPECLSMTCAGILRGTGYTKEVAIYSFFSIACFRPLITAFFLYELDMGLMGGWLALCLDQSLRGLCAAGLLLKKPIEQKIVEYIK